MQALDRKAESREWWLDRPLVGLAELSWEKAAYLALLVIAFVLRYWDLGVRMLHHDESLHYVYSWYLYVGRGYTHDPMMHGPLQFHTMALMYFLFGASEATARFSPALFGTAMVIFPYFLRQELGRVGAVLAALLLTFSPSFLYYSRFTREDIYTAFFTLLIVIGIFGYLRSRQLKHMLVFAAGVSLSFCQKENTYITVAIFGSFLFLVAGVELLKLWRTKPELSPVAEVLLVLGTLSLPLMTGFVLIPGRYFGVTSSSYVFLGGVFVALAGISALLGIRWNPRVWLWSAAVFWGIFVLLYTTFFYNPQGFATGTVGGLAYWLEQQGVARGGQPWFYYLVLMPLYEFIPVIFGLAGIVYCVWRQRSFFTSFLVYWAFGVLVFYGWASEKMPWLVLHLTLPFLLLAAFWLGRVIEGIDWRALPYRRSIYFAGGLLLAVVAVAAVWREGSSFLTPATPLETQRQLFRWLAMLAVFGAVIYFALQQGWALGRQISLRLAVLVLFLGLFALSIRTAWQVVYYNGDIPVEMLVYTQTSPDVGKVMREIERVGFRTGAGKDVVVAYDSSVSWPFEWYLRDYKQRVFYGKGDPPADAPVVLVGFEDNHDARVAPLLKAKYVGQRYRLRWWFPEDYREIRPDSFWWALFDGETRTKLWNYFIYRETFNPLGSTDFMFYIRKDLANGPWEAAGAGLTTVGRAAPADAGSVEVSLPSQLAFGSRGAADGQLMDPKNAAVAPDGSLYVVDTFNHRVQHFDAQGRFLGKWGEKGDQPGQFNEPWGIAVDAKGNVYVADTWNHRIQKFDAQGTFLATWGRHLILGGDEEGQDGFFGPRAVAIDAQGSLWITDTGNHRLAKYSPDGKLIAYFGERGDGGGQFNEPVGVSIDAQGYIYVADTWNRRIQKLDRDFAPIAEWPVPGWETESVVNKPYLAVDSTGHLYASDPENHRILAFSTAGRLLRSWGRYGSDEVSMNLPTGLTVTGEGVFVVDSANSRLLRFPALGQNPG